jgi:cytochrome c-type biogenesis protein CcmE
MKRFVIVLMALLIVAGTAGMAAAALTFDVDFWTCRRQTRPG